MKNIRALIWSATASIWLVVAMTIASELSKSFKSLLTVMMGHHWVTKSILSLVFWVVIYLLLKKMVGDDKDEAKEIYRIVGSALFGGLIIFLFYLWHFLE